MKNAYYLIAVLSLLIFSCSTQKNTEQENEIEVVDYAQESSEDFNNRMEWWRDARFGMFIHWGVYAVPAGNYNGKEVGGIGEWIMYNAKIPHATYEKFAKKFNPIKFDADEWALTMKKAGMKYVVITSKHHDGFAMWDSEVSDYDIVDFAPYGKDVLKALSEACKKQGIKFGVYHSIIDWHHPDAQADTYTRIEGNKPDPEINAKEFAQYFEHYLKPQIKELIDNYDPAIMWFDGEWEDVFTHEQGLALYQYVRSLKPDIIINNRVDKGRKGMQGMNKEGNTYAGDFGTPEQEILESASALDWESCMTMNNTWGFKLNDHNWKSGEQLTHNLIDVAAKGGNYLLNVGPTAEGEIPMPSVERLAQMGNWLAVNGEAIYETEKLKNHYKQGAHIRFTKKKGQGRYYAITLQAPENEITFKHVRANEHSSIYMLGYDQPLPWTHTEHEGLKISIPQSALESVGHTFAWVFKIQGTEVDD